MNRLLSAVFVLLPPALYFLASCHPPVDHSAAQIPRPDSVDQRNYVPVEDLLRSEIAGVDSMPYRVMLYHLKDGKKDSVLLKPGQFDAQAKAFLLPGLDSASIASRFTESSFMDQSTGLLNFTYSTRDTLFGVRRVDILLEPSLNTDKIASIYLEQSVKDNDSVKLKKLTWTSGKHFSILEIVRPPQGASFTRETRVVWNN